MKAALLTLIVVVATACGPIRKRSAGRVTLAVLPAESDVFPKAAQAMTDSLTKAEIAGVDERQVSTVSLEVVQLSIECVEPTVACYEAVGKSLAAQRLLFGEIARGGKKKQLIVSVTLFDVEARAPKTAKKVFANEQEATAGIPDLVAEATR